MLIEIKSIRKSYLMGETVVLALRGVSLTIEAGEFIAIMGPSGSGKSTLIHLLGLLDVPDSGSYKLLENEVSKLSENELAELRNETIGFVFQQFNLLARTSSLENVALPLIYSRSKRNFKKPKELMEEVGLAGRINHKPNELSGGQQQRVAIARALVNDPRIIFADEPTGNLDSQSQEEIMGILKNLNENGMTIVLVTHEEEVARYAHRVIRMRDGMILSDESQDESLSNSALKTLVRKEIKPPETKTPAVRKTPTLSLFEAADHFKQAWKALTANKIRTALSMLGILIGVGAVIAMLALGSGAKAALEKQLSSLGTNLLMLSPGSRRTHGVAMQAGQVTRFTLTDVESIRNLPSVKRSVAEISGRVQVVYGNKNWNSRATGSTPDYAPMRNFAPAFGRFFTEEENLKRSRVAVIGQTVVRELFAGENPLGEWIKVNKINFQVVGILAAKGATGWQDQDDLIIVPLMTGMKRLMGKEYVDAIDIEVDNTENMDQVQDDVTSLIIKTHHLPPSQEDSFEIHNMAEIQATLEATSKTMAMLLGSIAAISLLVGGIGIMNIMLVSVTERTREIGLRKALGARKLDILSQFLIESIVISLAGGILGLALGSGVSFLFSKIAGWSTQVSLQSVMLAVLFSMSVGIVFGFWPAKKAAQLNPIEALRYE